MSPAAAVNPIPPVSPPAQLAVLAGPTAVGKGTVSKEISTRYPQIWLSVSVTTRAPRPGEVPGEHYYFVSDEEFDAMVAGDQLLEWAVVHGTHRYGTPRGPVEERLAAGQPVLLEIDLNGARQVRSTMPAAVFVFLAPPSIQELQRRLAARGTEDVAERARRLQTAEVEMAAESEFDFTVVNRTVRQAADDLVHLLGLRPGQAADDDIGT